MKRLAILFTVLIISGCGLMQPKLVSVKPQWPEPYVDDKTKQMAQCEELMKIENRDMQSVFNVLVNNYKLYYQCSTHVEGWNEWYRRQKDIYDKVK